MELFDLTKVLSAHPELFKNQIRILTNDMIDTMERTPEERQKIKQMGLLEEMRDVIEILSQIEQLKANGLNAQVLQSQAQAMLSQMESQMQGQQGAAAEPSLSRALPEGGGQPSGQPGGAPPQPEQSGPSTSQPGTPVQTRRGNFQP